MADTVLDVMKRVLVATAQDPNIQAISYSDDTQYLLDRMNEALRRIRSWDPTYKDSIGTITITPSTRTFAPPTGLDVYDIYPRTFRMTNSNGVYYRIEHVNLDTVLTLHTDYQTATVQTPTMVYYDDGQICIYPLLASDQSNRVMTYRYPALDTRLTAITDTFPYPDTWLLYIEKCAQFYYEEWKGLSQPTITFQTLLDLEGEIMAKIKVHQNFRMRGYRTYNRRRWQYGL